MCLVFNIINVVKPVPEISLDSRALIFDSIDSCSSFSRRSFSSLAAKSCQNIFFVNFRFLDFQKYTNQKKNEDFSSPATTFPFQPKVELYRSREDPARSRVSTRDWPSRLEARVSWQSSCLFPTNIRQPNDHRLLQRLVPEFISIKFQFSLLL